MTTAALKFIADTLQSIGINYEFQEWTTDPVPDPYYIGEYTEIAGMEEDGQEESDFMLTGTTRTSWFTLEQTKATIKQAFPPVGGTTIILPNGNGLVIFYSDSFQVPTGDAELKRIQINLKFKEWSVN